MTNLNRFVNTISLLVIAVSAGRIGCDYWDERAKLVKAETSRSIGSSIDLNEREMLVDQFLMYVKLREYDAGISDPQKFLPAQHFFHTRSQIEQSAVFKFLRDLPKGASLHSHDTALVSGDYLYNLTFKDNLYGCVVNKLLQLRFFKTKTSDECKWQRMQDLRKNDPKFDDYVKTQINIICDDPLKRYSSVNDVWAKFSDTFSTVHGLICYKPVFKEYFYQVLKELYEDNVMYLEFRGTLPEVYDLDGNIYGPEEVVGIYIEVLNSFKNDYPDFHGARFIYAPVRHVNVSIVKTYVKTALTLKQLYPDFIAGFDLVGQEDLGMPLKYFVKPLMELSGKMKFFFHAGETDWNGAPPDSNLIDAVLLNTSRIGHGFGITKHPEVLRAVKEKNIAIEISPISNQVLMLVQDMRNHPGSFLFANDYPVVICCDDPSFWGAKALSYDWYMAFMGMAHRNSGLKTLKQLAMNSILYSAMDEDEKQVTLNKWKVKWNQFIGKSFAKIRFIWR